MMKCKQTDLCSQVTGTDGMKSLAISRRGRGRVVLAILMVLGIAGSGLFLHSVYSNFHRKEIAEDKIIELVGRTADLDRYVRETAHLAVQRSEHIGLADQVERLLSRRREAVEALRKQSPHSSREEAGFRALEDASSGLDGLYGEVASLVRQGRSEEAGALLQSKKSEGIRGEYERAFAAVRAALFDWGHRTHEMWLRVFVAGTCVTVAIGLASLFLFFLIRQKQGDNAFLLEILESIPHPLRVVDPKDHTILMRNSAGAAEERRDVETCYGALYGRSEPCDDLDRPCPVEIVRKTGKPASIVHALERDGGGRTWRQVHAYPILNRQGTVERVIEHHVDVTQMKRVEEELKRHARALDERVKELNCLYEITRMTEGLEHEPAALCRNVVHRIPAAWRYPEVTHARILLHGEEYRTRGYRESPWSMHSDVRRKDEVVGRVEVLYAEERPQEDEGPFLAEERHLLEAIARHVGKYAEDWAVHEDLAESEKRHKQVVDNANDAIIVIQDGQMVFQNRKTAELIGREQEELGSRPFVEFIAPEDREMVMDRYLRRLQGEDVEPSYAVRVIHGSGEVLWAEISNVVLDWNGRPATLCFIRDITDRKRMIQRVEESEEKLRCISAQAQDAIVMIDGEGDISFWNEAAERTFGYPADEVLGRNLHRLLAPVRYHEAHFEAFRRFQGTGEGEGVGKSLELAALRKNGEEIPVELSLSGVKLKGRWNAIGILRDITDRKRLERELREAKEKAEATNLAKSQFLANMSHEIRTPLNGIIGMTALAMKTGLTDDQKRYLEAVKSSSDYLLEILNDVLDLSKVEADRLELEEIEFDLPSALEFTLGHVAFRAQEKGLELLSDIPPDLPWAVVGDPGRLRQIVLNLLNNAIKFTEAGEVKLSCAAGEERSGRMEFRFVVSDTGIGVPEEKQDRIFEVFLQADGSMTRKYGGTGLGLPIAKALCEQMGGTMWVESEPGRGSSFHFTVMLGRQSPEAAGKREPCFDQLKGKKVLVAAGNPESRRILSEMLSHWGVVCEAAGDGAAAMEGAARAAAHGRPYDLLILDSGMLPPEAQRNSREGQDTKDTVTTPVVLLTDAVKKGASAPPAGDRIVARLCKPVRRSELLDALLKGITGGYASACDPEAHEGTEPVPGRRTGLRILLAEDNPINQLMAKKTLEMFGHTVTLAVNGKEAVERVREETFDVLLMDGQMPVMDGLEATRLIRIHERETGGSPLPVLAMTAHAMKGDRERFLAAGMDDYIAKPIDPDGLREMLDRWGEKRESAICTRQENAATPEPKEADLDETVPVNLEKALARACGDKAFLEEMILHFVGDISEQLERLERILDTGDATGLTKQAHTLKGSAATLGADRIASVALQLEESGRTEDLSEGKKLLSELARETTRLTEYVNRPGWMEVG